MIWNVPSRNIVNKRVVIPFSDITRCTARDSVQMQLKGPVFIAGGVKNQAKAINQFIGRLNKIDLI